jgi:hypothetical protein
MSTQVPEVIDNTRGLGFDHACSGVWTLAGRNKAGHDVFTCDSGRHVCVAPHRSADHKCLTALNCASAEVTS